MNVHSVIHGVRISYAPRKSRRGAVGTTTRTDHRRTGASS
jgi:hypothetical protein